MQDYQRELALARQLAQEAGKIMLAYFNSKRANATLKADKTIVTKADLEINARVIELLKEETPTYAVHGEEQSHAVQGAPYTWVCDPVDGTMPFAKGVPISTFSLALVDTDGQSVLGVVYDPFQDRLFEAVRGRGTYANGVRITVSDISQLEGSYIDEEMWVNKVEGISFNDPRDRLSKAGAKVTVLCSAVISGCLVAQGEYDAMLFGQAKPEDIAALAVIVTEAGGNVTDLFGNLQRYDTSIRGAIVSNGLIHDDLVELLKGIHYKNPHVV